MNSKIGEIREPCQPNLQHMPKVVMEEVLKNLDCPSIFRLRKVCRDLRFTIDDINPELHLHRIFFELPLTTSSIKSYLENKDKSSKEFYIKHNPPRSGCTIGWQQENKYKLAEISMKDIEILLKNSKLILDVLSISLHFSIEDISEYIKKKEENLKKFYESLKSQLENLGQLLRTKEIVMQFHKQSEAAGLLKSIDPKSLKYISIQANDCRAHRVIEMNFSELEELEQWKKAEKLRISGNYILTPIESFSSFKTITIWVNEIPVEKLNEVKKLFVQSPKLKTFIIESFEVSEMKNQLISKFSQFDFYDNQSASIPVFESRLRGTRKTWKWIKDVPESTEKLQISLNVGWGNYNEFSKVQSAFQL